MPKAAVTGNGDDAELAPQFRRLCRKFFSQMTYARVSKAAEVNVMVSFKGAQFPRDVILPAVFFTSAMPFPIVISRKSSPNAVFKLITQR